MSTRPSPSRVTRLVTATTQAGPSVSASAAAASVARLRKAVHWSQPYLSRLTGLEDAAAAVSSTRALVVDRRGAVRVIDSFLARVPVRAGSLPLVPSGLVLRTFAARSKGIWDPWSRRRILVAPNVLAACERFSLDQVDYGRWVAVRAGLWAVHLEHAPHLVDHLLSLAGDLPARAADFIRLGQLLDALPTAEMEVLTPADIPSVDWIRRHKVEPAALTGLRSLSRFGVPVADLDEQRERVTDFARAVVSGGDLALLLGGVDALPTAEEIDDPAAWRARLAG